MHQHAVRTIVASVIAAALLGPMALAAPGQTPQHTPQNQPASASEPAAPAAAHAVTVPVKRVVLFASGVGFFEHDGTVTGNATTELPFKTQQLNDVLMSLVVSDSGGGLVHAVTYPSLGPLAKTLKTFQIDFSNIPSMH